MKYIIKLLFILSAMSAMSHLSAITVGIVGDSISVPYPVAKEQGWPHIVAERYGWDVVNCSVGGATTETLMFTVQKLATYHNPSIIIICLGINDAAQGKPQQEVYENIYLACKWAHNHNIHCIVGTVDVKHFGWHGKEYSENFVNLYAMLKLKLHKKAHFFPFMTTELESDRINWWGSDPVHPNHVGHQKIALALSKLEKLWVRE